MAEENITQVLAEELAAMDLDIEMQKRHDLAQHRDSLLQSKVHYYKKKLEASRKKSEAEFTVLHQVLNDWLEHLPNDRREQFQKQLNVVREKLSHQEFYDQLFTLFHDPNASMQTLLNLSDEFIDSLRNEAQRLQTTKHFNEGVCLNKLIMMLNPTFIETYRSIGYCHFCLRELDEAQDFFDLSIALAPEDPKGYYLSALCSKERNELEHARIFCKAGLELSKKFPDWEKQFKELVGHL